MVDNRDYASVAELSIAAEEQTDAVEAMAPVVKTGTPLYIKEVQSGLYLHYKPDASARHDGDYCLAPLDVNDASFRFTFTAVSGFKSFFKVRCLTRYLGAGDEGWRIVETASTADKNGWIQVEALPNGNARLHGVWNDLQYFNFDSRTTDSYVYADKAAGAEFYISNSTTTGIEPLSASTAAPQISYVDGVLYVHTDRPSTVSLLTPTGAVADTRRCQSGIAFTPTVQAGVYIVSVSCEGSQGAFTKKIYVR